VFVYSDTTSEREKKIPSVNLILEKNKQQDQFVLQRQIITIGVRDKISGGKGSESLENKIC
jgi:hypothetical protein